MSAMLSRCFLTVSLMMLSGMAAFIAPCIAQTSNEQATSRTTQPGASVSDFGMRGVTLPYRQVLLHAPVEGRLDRILVEVGDHVKQDEVLAVMDDALQRQQVQIMTIQAQSTLEEQKAKLELLEAEEKLEQMEQVHARGGASEWELRREILRRDLAQNAIERARENQRMAQVKLELEKDKLERYQLKTDWPGRVRQIVAHSGATLTRQDPVMQVVDTSKLQVELYVPISLYGQLQEEQNYQLMARDPINKTISANLQMVDPIMDPASQTFRCVFIIENPENTYPGGMAVELLWPQKTQN